MLPPYVEAPLPILAEFSSNAICSSSPPLLKQPKNDQKHAKNAFLYRKSGGGGHDSKIADHGAKAPPGILAENRSKGGALRAGLQYLKLKSIF